MAESTDKPVPEQDETSRGAWTRRELGGKTVWDWLQLLIVPIMLSLITIAFTWQQDVRQQRIEDSRAEQARKIEDRRAEAEQAVQEQRAQQATLQAYLDQMGTLLLDRDLHGADEDSDVRRLARARTLVVLDALDPGRQNKVFRFLSETELIQAGTGDRPPIVSLKYASLRGFELQGKHLLENTDLTQAKLYGADLSQAHLEATDLSGAHLEDANLEGASLVGASLSGAYLRDVHLGGADLSGAYLTDADGRFESGARMNGADLSGADLSGADLTNAEVTRDQLQRVASLKGATLPDGSRYER
jgi:uncharacterized protein YjbI with pentapeptide repeats